MLRQLLDVQLQMEMIITERAGMVAENQQRMVLGQSLAYTNEDFCLLNNTLAQLLEVVRNL